MIEKEVIISVKEEGFEDIENKVDKLDKSLSGLDDTNKELGSTMDGTSQSVLDNGGAMGLLNDATGGLAMTVKDAVEASALFAKQSKIGMAVQKAYTFVMGTSSGALKVFKLALIGTGIGAIVIALVALIANFGKVKDAVMKLIPGLKSVGDFFGKIIDAVTDFVGVTSDATREMDKLNKASEKMLENNKDLLASFGDQLTEFQKNQIDVANTLAERLKEIKDREDITDAKRAELVKEAQERAKRDLLKNIDDTNAAAAEKRKEEYEKLAEERKAERERIANEKREQYDLDQEEIKRQKELSDELAEEERKSNEEGNALLAEFEAEEEQAKIEAEEERLRISQEAKAKELADEEAVKDAKIQIANQTLNIIGMLAKKGSKVAKGVAAAQALMNTYQGITAALAAPSTIPEPFGFALKLANAAAVGVSGLMNVKNILKTDETGTSVGGGGGSVQSPSAPSFNLVQGTGSNQITEGINNQDQPIKAFVVSSDVSTGQEMDRKIVEGASL